MARDKDQDDKDWDAIRRQKQRERDLARERAQDTAAAEQAKQQARDDAEAKGDFAKLLGMAEDMSDAALERAIDKYGKRHGRLTGKDKDRIRNAKGKKGCLGALALMAMAAAGLLYGMYEGVTAIASALF